MAEIENLNRVIKRPKENPFNGTTAQIQEIIAMFKGNLKSKNAAGFNKCLDLIEMRTEKLVSKQKELTAKLDLIVRNTADDIKRIKLEDGSSEGFEVELTQSIFDEKNSCKQKYKTYLEKARVILGYKKEMKEFSDHILEELERISAQIRDYQVVVENIKVSLQSVILPEVARRREFDALNKQYTAFYWSWITQETESREKFIDTGDLQQLPLAFKKILVDFIFDEDFEVEARAAKPESFRDLASLNGAMKSYFERWSISPEASLKGKLEEYLRDNNSIRDEVASLSIQLEKACKDREKLLRRVEEKEREVSLLKSKCSGSEGLKDQYEERISELCQKVEAITLEKQSIEDRCRTFSTQLSSVAQQLNSKSTELEASKRESGFEISSLKQKLANTFAEAQRAADSQKALVDQLMKQLAVASEKNQKSGSLETQVNELSTQNRGLTLQLENKDSLLLKVSAELKQVTNDLQQKTSILDQLKLKQQEQEKAHDLLHAEYQALKQSFAALNASSQNSKVHSEKENQQIEDLIMELSTTKFKLEESEEISAKLAEEKETLSYLLKDFESNLEKQSAIRSNLEQEILSLKHDFDKSTESYEAKLDWCQKNHLNMGGKPKPAEEQNPAFEQLKKDYIKLKETVSVNLSQRIKAHFDRYEATFAGQETRITGLDRQLEKLAAKHEDLKRNQIRLI